MKCDACGADDSDCVTDTLKFPHHNERVRKCKKCGFQWTTGEVRYDLEATLWLLRKVTLELSLLRLEVTALQGELDRQKRLHA